MSNITEKEVLGRVAGTLTVYPQFGLPHYSNLGIALLGRALGTSSSSSVPWAARPHSSTRNWELLAAARHVPALVLGVVCDAPAAAASAGPASLPLTVY